MKCDLYHLKISSKSVTSSNGVAANADHEAIPLDQFSQSVKTRVSKVQA